MRRLLDQGIPRSAAKESRQAGEDAVHAGDMGMAAAADPVIPEVALREDRVVATPDAHFLPDAAPILRSG